MGDDRGVYHKEWMAVVRQFELEMYFEGRVNSIC